VKRAGSTPGSEPLNELVPVRGVVQTPGVTEPVQVLPPSEARVQRQVTGQVAGPRMDGDRVTDRVQPEDPDPPGRCPMEAEQ